MSENSVKIIALDSLRIGYNAGKHAKAILPPLSASSSGGELIAVIGRNGIGKSTLLRTISGLQQSIGGAVLLNNKNILEYPRFELARRVGYISTEVVKPGNMRVVDLVALGRFPHTNWLGRTDHHDRLAIENSISRTGLTALRYRHISEISDGERQKAMIARVLAQDTELMIMDEPTAFLDIASKHEIVNLMLELTRDGKTIIFSTHDFNIAVNQADKIWLMLENKLVEGAPEDLMLNGVLEHLFDSSIVRFNSGDGSFSFLNESRGGIFIEGEGTIRRWTEKAVIRAGYKVSDIKTDPYVQIPPEANNEWLLVANDITEHFNSVYDLMKRLRR